MKSFVNALVNKLTAKKSVPVVKLADIPEAAVVAQVRNTLKMARDYFQKHGRTILAVDIQCYLAAFDEAVGFDRLERSPVLLPTNRDKN